jgi:hypothetical protein
MICPIAKIHPKLGDLILPVVVSRMEAQPPPSSTRGEVASKIAVELEHR